MEANKAVKKLQSTKSKLVFPDVGDPKKLHVEVYKDASHASLPSGASQGAYIVFLCGNGKVSPLTWKSKRLNRVTKIPLASETSALAEAADAGFLVASIVQEVFGVSKIPIVKCNTDNKSLYEHLQSTKIIQDSRLRVDITRLREMVELGEIVVKWIPKHEQLADPLTKAGASSVRLLEVLRTGMF